MEEFNKPKIVWGNLNLSATYALIPNNVMINAPATMIVPASNYLLCILNSKLADYYIRNLGVTRNGRISSSVLLRSSSVLQFESISSRFSLLMINASLNPVLIP